MTATRKPAAPIVSFDLAGPNAPQLQAFYADVFGWRAGESGQMIIPITAPIPTASPN